MSNGLVARRSAVAATVGFAAYAVYQIALAAGAPLGRGAWGGTHTQLPPSLRLASIAAIAFYGLAALLVLRRAGFRVRWISPTVARIGTWLIAAVLALSAFGNFLSQSPWERFLNGPVALILAALCLIVARSAPGTVHRADASQGPNVSAPRRLPPRATQGR
jgi:hypothetical protein